MCKSNSVGVAMLGAAEAKVLAKGEAKAGAGNVYRKRSVFLSQKNYTKIASRRLPPETPLGPGLLQRIRTEEKYSALRSRECSRTAVSNMVGEETNPSSSRRVSCSDEKR